MPKITIELSPEGAKRLREHTGAATTRAAVNAILQPWVEPDEVASEQRDAGEKRLVTELRAEDRRGSFQRFSTAGEAMRWLET